LILTALAWGASAPHLGYLEAATLLEENYYE
jgi:hypothetical protein